MDQVEWWADFLSSELEEVADVEYEALSGSDDGNALARVRIIPRRAGAMPMTVTAGGGEVARIEFGQVAEQLCAGVPSRVGGVGPDSAGLDVSNQLGVMIAATVADGASLHRHRFGRRCLIVGPVDHQPESAGLDVVATWLPYADEYVATSLFRRPPDYAQLPGAAFLVRAFPSIRPRR